MDKNKNKNKNKNKKFINGISSTIRTKEK